MRAFMQQSTGTRLAVAFGVLAVLGVLCILPTMQAARESGRSAGGRAQLGYLTKDGARCPRPRRPVRRVNQARRGGYRVVCRKGVGAGETVVAIPQDDKGKIIYNGHVEVAVEDFTGLPDRVRHR